MRVTWFKNWAMKTANASFLAAKLDELLSQTEAGSDGFIGARLPAVAWAANPEHASATRTVCVAANEQRHHHVERFLAASRGMDPTDTAAPRRRESKAPVPELTLGSRKTLARSRERHRLERLLMDPDPAVLGMLLQNPMVSEQDVLRVTSSRTTPPSQLFAVLSTPRWLSSLAVRRALALNPKTSAEAAIPMLWVLRRQDLRDVMKSQTLPRERRLRAQELLERSVPVPRYVKRDGVH